MNSMNKISIGAGIVLIILIIGYVANQTKGSSDSFYYGTVSSLEGGTGTLLFRSETAGGEEELIVSPHDHILLGKGERIRGELSESDGTRRLERIWPAREEDEVKLREVQHRLKVETDARRMKPARELGEKIAEFVLYNQYGKLENSRDWEGKYVVVAFVFSRCPLPDMCPATILRLKQLAHKLDKTSVNYKLVAVTMDPEWDTPGVLHRYASSADAQKITFLTGPWMTMKYLFRQFGLAVQPDEKIILKHTMMTALIGPDGTLLMNDDTSLWSLEEFYEKIISDSSKQAHASGK